MPGRSVSTNLLDFTSTCISHIEQKAQIDVIYTDLKPAFDRIDQKILLKKSYGLVHRRGLSVGLAHTYAIEFYEYTLFLLFVINLGPSR